MAVVSRINWEFFAVLDGRCAPLFQKGERGAMAAKTLWVFPPETVHGWAGEASPCRIVTLHFGSVPAVLERRARQHGFLAISLGGAQIRQLKKLAASLEPHFRRPHTLSILQEEKAVLELSLLALEGTETERLITLPTLAHDKVEAAIAAFRANLSTRPCIRNIAASVHVSPAHLRRLFWQVRAESPRQVFGRITMERALELLSQTTMTLNDIAAECGFVGASEFCRAFKTRFGVPPAIWRSGILPPYKPPVKLGRGELAYPQEQHPTVVKLSKYIARH